MCLYDHTQPSTGVRVYYPEHVYTWEGYDNRRVCSYVRVSVILNNCM